MYGIKITIVLKMTFALKITLTSVRYFITSPLLVVIVTFITSIYVSII